MTHTKVPERHTGSEYICTHTHTHMTQTKQPEGHTQKVCTYVHTHTHTHTHTHANTHTPFCVSRYTYERENGTGAVTDVERGADREQCEVHREAEDTYIIVGMRSHM